MAAFSLFAVSNTSLSTTVYVEAGRKTGALTRARIERRGARLVNSNVPVDAALFAVGSLGDGRKEGERWRGAVRRYAEIGGRSTRGLFVVRSLWVREVVSELNESISDGRPWIVLRPGALDETNNDESYSSERVLVTRDIRANGRLSRHFLAEVLATLCLQSNESIFANDVLGVYDLSRMVALPKNVINLWP